MKAIKIIAPFLGIALILFNVFQYSVFNILVHSQKIKFRSEVIASSTASKKIDLTTESLYQNSPGIEWKENNKEVVINGVFHEVIAIHINGFYSTLIVVPDYIESTLFKAYFNSLSDHNQTVAFSILMMAIQYVMPIFSPLSELFSEDFALIPTFLSPLSSGFLNELIIPPGL